MYKIEAFVSQYRGQGLMLTQTVLPGLATGSFINKKPYLCTRNRI